MAGQMQEKLLLLSKRWGRKGGLEGLGSRVTELHAYATLTRHSAGWSRTWVHRTPSCAHMHACRVERDLGSRDSELHAYACRVEQDLGSRDTGLHACACRVEQDLRSRDSELHAYACRVEQDLGSRDTELHAVREREASLKAKLAAMEAQQHNSVQVRGGVWAHCGHACACELIVGMHVRVDSFWAGLVCVCVGPLWACLVCVSGLQLLLPATARLCCLPAVQPACSCPPVLACLLFAPPARTQAQPLIEELSADLTCAQQAAQEQARLSAQQQEEMAKLRKQLQQALGELQVGGLISLAA